MTSSNNQLQNLPELLLRLSPYHSMLHVEQSLPIHQGHALSMSWVSTSGPPIQYTLFLRSFWFLEKAKCFFRGLSHLLIFTIVTRGWILFQDYFSQQNKTQDFITWWRQLCWWPPQRTEHLWDVEMGSQPSPRQFGDLLLPIHFTLCSQPTGLFCASAKLKSLHE